MIDLSLRCLIRRKDNRIPDTFKSILICNGAHLGDVILTTSLFSPLKSKLPDIKIGMLVGSWSRQAIENHPDVNWIHCVDHWKLNRSQETLRQKFMRYRETKRHALTEIKKIGYDIAIDCPFHFPNSAPILWRAKIPARIGFINAGLSPLLTKAVNWTQNDKQTVAEIFFSLVKTIIPHKPGILKPRIPYFVCSKKSYIVIHMGTGSARREWRLKKWIALCTRLVNDGHSLYFTGHGDREQFAIECVAKGLKQTINLCSLLSWQEFVNCIAEAQLFVGVNSCGGHIAAAVDTPAVLIYADETNPNIWRPPSDKLRILAHKTHDCHAGHHAIKFLDEISVGDVYAAVNEMMPRPTFPASNSFTNSLI